MIAFKLHLHGLPSTEFQKIVEKQYKILPLPPPVNTISKALINIAPSKH